MASDAPGKAKRRTGRPFKEIPWEQCKKLAALQCTSVEIAAYCGVNYETLDLACKREHNLTFPRWYAQFRQHGKISLRRTLYRAAQKGNMQAAIFLAKQGDFLGYSDKMDQTIQHRGGVLSVTMGEQLMAKIFSDPDTTQLARDLMRKTADLPEPQPAIENKADESQEPIEVPTEGDHDV